MLTTFRGFLACPHHVVWLPVYERELQRRGILGPNEVLPISQLVGFFGGSGSTHGLVVNGVKTGGGATDVILTGERADRAVWVARQMGAPASWHRPAGWDGPGSIEHCHLVLRGCTHLTPAAQAQIVAVENGGDGLVGDTPDPGPRPIPDRDWKQGIEWQQRQEDPMPLWSEWPAEEKKAFLADVSGASAKATVRRLMSAVIDNAGTKFKSAVERIDRFARRELDEPKS